MICPRCQTVCEEQDRYCFHCGAALTEPPVPKKGSRLVPIAVLCLISLAGLIMFFLHPLSAPESDTPWFTLTDGVLYFDESLYEGPAEVTVPASIGGQPVLHLADGCFEGITGLTAVHLPQGLQSIGDGAFYGCDSLRGIELPEGLTSIGRQAFSYCTRLEAISVPGSVESIGEGAFDGCEKLVHIFYAGENSRWKALYDGHINLYTHVYCTDGDFLHR